MSEYTELKTIKARVEYLRIKLSTDPRWAIRGLLKIYEAQTADEQASGHTTNLNGVGFSGVDSEILSSFATQIQRGRTMSPKQMALIYKKMKRYAKQLEQVSRPAPQPDLTEQMRDPNEEEGRSLGYASKRQFRQKFVSECE